MSRIIFNDQRFSQQGATASALVITSLWLLADNWGFPRVRGWVTKNRLGNSESGGHRSQGGKKTNVLLFTNKDISVLACGLYSLYNAFSNGSKSDQNCVGRW